MLIPVLNRFLPVVQVPAALSIGTASSSVSRIAIFIETLTGKLLVIFANSFAGSMAGKLAAELY